MLLKGNRNTDPFRCTFLPWPRTRRWSSRGTRTTAASHWTTSRWSPWQTCSPVGHVQEPNQFYPIVSLIKSSYNKTIFYHWYNVNATRQNILYCIINRMIWIKSTRAPSRREQTRSCWPARPATSPAHNWRDCNPSRPSRSSADRAKLCRCPLPIPWRRRRNIRSKSSK